MARITTRDYERVLADRDRLQRECDGLRRIIRSYADESALLAAEVTRLTAGPTPAEASASAVVAPAATASALAVPEPAGVPAEKPDEKSDPVPTLAEATALYQERIRSMPYGSPNLSRCLGNATPFRADECILGITTWQEYGTNDPYQVVTSMGRVYELNTRGGRATWTCVEAGAGPLTLAQCKAIVDIQYDGAPRHTALIATFKHARLAEVRQAAVAM